MTDPGRGHLNSIQDICTGGPEFALGEMYGLREWSFNPRDPLQLVGHNRGVWTVGETFNAECTLTGYITETRSFSVAGEPDGYNARRFNSAARTYVAQVVDELRESSVFLGDLELASLRLGVAVNFKDYTRHTEWLQANWMLDDPFSDFFDLELPEFALSPNHNTLEGVIEISARKGDHVPAHPMCTCGVYAYHDIDALPSQGRGHDSVYGLTRLYGHITVGTKGLRAEKADIIALTLPGTELHAVGRGSIADLRDKIIAHEVARNTWAQHGITVVSDVQQLVGWGIRGGFLEAAPPAYPEGTPDPPGAPKWL